MDTPLEPRAVSPKNLIVWLREALDLITRRWLLTIAIMVPVTVGLSYAPLEVQIWGCPLFAGWLVALFAVIGQCTDQRESILPALRRSALGFAQLTAYAMVKQAIWVALWSALLHLPAIAAMVGNIRFPIAELSGGVCLLAGLTIAWWTARDSEMFLVALFVNARLNWPAVNDLSSQAARLNKKVYWLTIAWGAPAMIAAALHGLFAIVLVPLSGAFLYCGYRDVFLARTENTPS